MNEQREQQGVGGNGCWVGAAGGGWHEGKGGGEDRGKDQSAFDRWMEEEEERL